MKFIRYEVMPNDNIHDISERFGVNILSVVDYNKDRYPHLVENFEALVTGMVLSIPKVGE